MRSAECIHSVQSLTVTVPYAYSTQDRGKIKGKRLTKMLLGVHVSTAYAYSTAWSCFSPCHNHNFWQKKLTAARLRVPPLLPQLAITFRSRIFTRLIYNNIRLPERQESQRQDHNRILIYVMFLLEVFRVFTFYTETGR